MLFLIEYDRSTGTTVAMTSYAVNQLKAAQDDRLRLELDLNRRGVSHEVVLLEADSEIALRQTHQRYFGNLRGMLEDWIKGREWMHRDSPPPAAD